jgi:hypothetical protein
VSKQRVWRIALTMMIVGIFAVQYKQVSLLERIASVMAPVLANNPLVTSWQSGGVTRTVTTEPNVGESDAALLVRHTEAVKKKLEEFPRDQ